MSLPLFKKLLMAGNGGGGGGGGGGEYMSQYTRLVDYYFEETSASSVFVDAAGNIDLTIENSGAANYEIASGFTGAGLGHDFVGNTAAGVGPTDALFDSVNSGTIVLCFRPRTSFLQSSRVFAFGDAAGSPVNTVSVLLRNTGRIWFYMADTSGDDFGYEVTAPLSLDNLYTVVVTQDGTVGGMKIYINGIDAAKTLISSALPTSSFIGTLGPGIDNITVACLRLGGANQNHANVEVFHAAVVEDVLTPTEAAAYHDFMTDA